MSSKGDSVHRYIGLSNMLIYDLQSEKKGFDKLTYKYKRMFRAKECFLVMLLVLYEDFDEDLLREAV